MLWITSCGYQSARYNQICVIHVVFLTCKSPDFQGLLSSLFLALAYYNFIYFFANEMCFTLTLCLSSQNLKGDVFFSGFLNVVLPSIKCYNTY